MKTDTRFSLTGLQLAPAVVLGGLMFLSPESPRWLIGQGRFHEGLKILAQLHAGGNQSDSWVQAEYEHIKESLAQEHEEQAKVCAIPSNQLTSAESES